MFESLSQRLATTVDRVRGKGRLTEDNIRETLREVRIALLEADVALPAVKDLIERVRERAVGQEVLKSLTPGQALVKIVSDEMTTLMGGANSELNLATQPPAVVLVAGLQGAGKTTTVAKLARLLRERHNKKVMVTSCDVYRPAAIEQLKTLAGQVGVGFFPSEAGSDPLAIARDAVVAARREVADVLLVDTAGRLHVDEKMMDEVKALHAALGPIETLFVVDSMTGQDAANTARAFDQALPLTGVILTKTDGDARGGAALSVRHVTGKPIKFIGAGEKTDALEPFHPDRLAQRILGMGDVLSLVEDVQRKVDHEKAQNLARKVAKGKRFDLEDMRSQFEQMLSMGGLAGLMDKLPGMSKLPDSVKSKVNDGEIRRMMAIIDSMTRKERRHPDLLKASRKARVAKGSGTQPADINRLLKQYKQMARMMGKMKGGGMRGMMRQMQGAMKGMGGPGGGMPPMG
ncbi:MAG: signal recognition particle protein [Rhodanobacteraceae bacterium]